MGLGSACPAARLGRGATAPFPRFSALAVPFFSTVTERFRLVSSRGGARPPSPRPCEAEVLACASRWAGGPPAPCAFAPCFLEGVVFARANCALDAQSLVAVNSSVRIAGTAGGMFPRRFNAGTPGRDENRARHERSNDRARLLRRRYLRTDTRTQSALDPLSRGGERECRGFLRKPPSTANTRFHCLPSQRDVCGGCSSKHRPFAFFAVLKRAIVAVHHRVTTQRAQALAHEVAIRHPRKHSPRKNLCAFVRNKGIVCEGNLAERAAVYGVTHRELPPGGVQPFET